MRYNESMASLSLISSSRCNMKCSFCYLHKNKSFYEYDKYLREVWRNGEYIEKVKETTDKMGIDPLTITNITFWGGETTIDLDDIIPALPKLFEYYPKIKRLWFSTNWHTSVDKIIDFYKAWGQAAPAYQYISMQASIDGPPGPCCEQGHPGDWDIYMKNYKRLAELWPEAQKEVPNLRWLKLTTNATINQDLFYDIFLDRQKTYDYLKFMIDKETEISAIVKAGGVLAFEMHLPGIALPHVTDDKDGIKYLACINNIENIVQEFFPNHQLAQYIPIRNNTIHYIDMVQQDYACGSMLHSLNILPDGSITECHSAFADVIDDYYNEIIASGDKNAILTSRINRKIAINPSKETPESIERIKAIINHGYRNTNSTITSLKSAMVKELALSGQVPKELADDAEQRLRLIRAASQLNVCSRENLLQSRNPYLGSPDQFRRFYNGTIQYMLNYPEKQSRIKELMV